MKTSLNFEDDETKNLLAKLDFDFFLKQNIDKEKYNQADVDTIYASYKQALGQIKTKSADNKKQSHYYAEGQVRKMFTGGFLPALFELDENRGHRLIDFNAVGDNWAYFSHWQTYQRRKIILTKIWDIVIKTGSILAILLSIIKLIETIFPHSKSCG